MQLSFRHKEQLFHELTQLEQSGVPFPKALEIMARNQRSHLGHGANLLRSGWEAAHTAAGAFAQAGFASRDISLVEAGESSGHLDEIFIELSAYYAKLAVAQRELIVRSLYPVIVLHTGIILMAIPPAIVSGGLPAFFKSVVPLLLGLYVLAALIALAGIFLIPQLAVNQGLARAFLKIPLLGNFFQAWTAWSFSLVLSLHVRAGGSLLESFRAAADACGNAALAAATSQAIEKIQRGSGLSEAFGGEQSSVVPEVLFRALEIGEHAGRLDEETSRAALALNQRVLRLLALIGTWLPRLLYFIVVLITLWQIYQMVTTMSGTVNSALTPE